MILTLEVPSGLAARLEQDAAASGVSVPEHALKLLDELHKPSLWDQFPPTEPFEDDGTLPDAADVRTGAELVAYWKAHGLIGTDTGTEDSSAMSRRLRAEIENERRGRHQ